MSPPATILDEIVSAKRAEIEAAKQRVPEADLRARLGEAPPLRDFSAAVRFGPGVGLIAEVKRASPSAGVIRADFDPVEIARTYARYGARCLSVLTDEPYFQGSLAYLEAIRQSVRLPLLRKDFIIDPYQVLEARVAGADCVLLIAECLPGDELPRLHEAIVAAGMQALVELYDAENLERVLALGASLVGINNRDLRTFQTDLEHTFRLAAQMPDDVLVVSESGISTAADVARLRSHGIAAMLVGESLMRQPEIGPAVEALLAGNR